MKVPLGIGAGKADCCGGCAGCAESGGGAVVRRRTIFLGLGAGGAAAVLPSSAGATSGSGPAAVGSGAAEQDLARIRAAQLLLETSGYPNMLSRLEPATAPAATFRHTARELLALSAWRANDTAAARQWLDLIANDGETPPSLRSRAEALQALLPPVAKS